MKAHIRLGRIFGVEIGLHASWFLIALLITLSLAVYFRFNNPEWGTGLIWGLAALTAVLFFASLVAHELAHALVARSRNLPVRSITLFALGGVAQIEKESGDPKTEFWMGIAGPVTSAAIGLVCLGLAQAAGWVPWTDARTPAMAALVWLGIINIALAVFNMIPGFPLDGGRVLRALIWWKTGDADRSTLIAGRVGQFVAAVFIGLGLLGFFAGLGFGGFWIAIIGWFLMNAASATIRQLELVSNLRGVRAADVMASDCAIADPRSDLQTFVDESLLRTGRRCFVIQENGHIEGIVTPNEVRQVDRSQWPRITLRQIMRPLDQLRTVRPETPLTEVMETMGREDINQLPVVSDRGLVGVVTRGNVLQYIQTRAELHM
ncbi:MAG: site-2 protease family protein [Bryobacteraceae bacterium]